jgi:hypothetical protein
MNKKCQVFISSTYLDLVNERNAAVAAILDAGHIPAGMELFVAEDKKQWDVITKWIDESDIYMLILGGRYGSIDKATKKSYTQLEFEYAISKNIPCFSLVLSEKALDAKVRGELGSSALEREDTRSYNEFKALVNEQLNARVNNETDIKVEVHRSLNQITKTRSLSGWIRSNSVIQSPEDAMKFGIKFSSVSDGDVIGKVDLHGVFSSDLPAGYEIRLTRAWPSLSGYYPLGGTISIDHSKKTWVARDCDIGGAAGDTRILKACIMDRGDVALFDYQKIANAEYWDFAEHVRINTADKFKGKPLSAIPYSATTFVCDTVTVRRA